MELNKSEQREEEKEIENMEQNRMDKSLDNVIQTKTTNYHLINVSLFSYYCK